MGSAARGAADTTAKVLVSGSGSPVESGAAAAFSAARSARLLRFLRGAPPKRAPVSPISKSSWGVTGPPGRTWSSPGFTFLRLITGSGSVVSPARDT